LLLNQLTRCQLKQNTQAMLGRVFFYFYRNKIAQTKKIPKWEMEKKDG